MITQAKKNGQRIMLIGLLLALVCSFFTYSAIQSAQPPKAVVRHQPIVMVGKRIPINTSMKAAIYGEGGTQETADAAAQGTCPYPELPSLPVGLLLICLQPEDQIASPSGIELDLLSEEQLKLENPQERQKVMNLVIFELLQQVGNTYTTVEMLPGVSLPINLLQAYPTIGKGMRAVALPVNAASNVGNRVSQGDHVDIVVTYLTKVNGETIPVTKVLFQNVEILGASDDQRFADRIPAEQRFGVLEVAPTSIVTMRMSLADATHLIYMSETAKDLRLVLRETGDSEVLTVQSVTPSTTEPVSSP